MHSIALALGFVVMLASCGDRTLSFQPNMTSDTQAVASTERDEKAMGLAKAVKVAPALKALRARRLGLIAGKDLKTSPVINEMDIAFGANVPFGSLARVCGAKDTTLGHVVDEASIPKFKLYDSAPNSITTRNFYLTGFADGCPRQFTAATAVFGTPSMYETLHFGPGAANFAYGQTDRTYEQIKQRVCGAGRGKPCGRKIQKLDKSTVFVSAYARAGASARWMDILIHDGVIMATSIKVSK